ncbi:SCO family protein [Pleionea sediminis]|uniref:SCO family protein n=1 Tax=Pleionea sediminis TaxID=2569479 RepID=UPI0011868DA9|nr:SCO family protein [Pleionea sediminis]
MNYLKQITVYSSITLAVILIGLIILSMSGNELSLDFSNQKEQPKNAMVYPKFRPVPDFSLKSGDTTLTRDFLSEKWSFVFFGYTYCPDVCPTTMSAMNSFYQNLPQEFQFDTQMVLISVDPDRDTPTNLSDYAKAFNPDFVGATAEHSQLETFARSFGAVYYKVNEEQEDYLVDHTAKIFLVDPDGNRHAFFSKSMENPTQGYEYNIPQMVEDYAIIRNNYR